MREAIFQQELKKTFQNYGYWCYKIPDIIKCSGLRFIPEKPSDLIVIGNNASILIECKQIKKICKIKKTFFANKKDKEQKREFQEYHQVKELLNFSKIIGNAACYMINIRIERKFNIIVYIEINDLIECMNKNEFILIDDLPKIQGRNGLFICNEFEVFLENMHKKIDN